jgi:Zn-finger nucleic acid-binding protein
MDARILRYEKMKCPKDTSELSPHKKGNIDVYSCPKCHGFLITLDQKPACELEVLLQKQFANPQSNSGEAEIISPSSGHAMRKFVYRSVILDYCADSHSIWFDRGEYSKIFALDSKTSKSIAGQGDSTSWNIADILTAPIDILDASGDVIGTVGDFIGDLISVIDI